MKAAAVFSLVSLLSLLGHKARAEEPRVARGEEILPSPPEPSIDDEAAADRTRGLTQVQAAPTIEGSIDYDLTYDDAVARTYDDGYDPRAAAQFQDALAPYGESIDDDTYGRIWQPAADEVGSDFSPYDTGGHWALTEYGSTWISDWDWGWAPFHYGRWLVAADRGWCWIPGTLWGPAWVNWRAGGGYVGWAPLPPRHMHIGSPLGPGSSWHFTTAADLWRGHPVTLPPQVAPRIFGRMAVVSNPRALPVSGAHVRVNAGPIFARELGDVPGPAARLASIAPRALPRRAIEAHAGAPVAQRPWMSAYAGPPVQAGDGGGDRSYVQRAAGQDPRRAGAPGVPRGQGQLRPVYPAPAPGGRRAPGMHAPTMTSARPYYPGARAPIFRAAPAIAPRPTAASAPTRYAPSASPRPSFGGAPPVSATRSFSGGHSFSGGSSFGHAPTGGSSFGAARGMGGAGSHALSTGRRR